MGECGASQLHGQGCRTAQDPRNGCLVDVTKIMRTASFGGRIGSRSGHCDRGICGVPTAVVTRPRFASASVAGCIRGPHLMRGRAHGSRKGQAQMLAKEPGAT